MPVMSMTGFARYEGEVDGIGFAWELRSVNGKGLDLRLRLPQGLEGLEADIRKIAAAGLTRGNVQIALQLRRTEEPAALTINEDMLETVLALSDRLVSEGRAEPPRADGLLSLRGIMEGPDTSLSAVITPERQAAVIDGFRHALADLQDARMAEGRALAKILTARLDRIAALTADAEADPARTLEAIRERLRAQVSILMDAEGALDEQRLYQEAALLATRADIREELDRLHAHHAAAAKLIEEGGPIGRRLDFLSQEFNRESNTLCSKSNATSLTAIGLELKVVIDQFKEQVQNIE